MTILLGLILSHFHPTLETVVCSRALILLVLDQMATLNHLPAVDTNHLNVRTHGFVISDLRLNALGLAVGVGATLDRLERTSLVMGCYFFIQKHFGASHLMMTTFELDLGQFLLHILPN